MPITGQPILAARSMILHIFSAMTSPSEPPKTVKSWLKTQTRRPSIVPWPVTTASPHGRFFCMSKSIVRWRTKVSSSWKEPGSSSFSIRSRAVILPRSCCFSSASGEECMAASRSSWSWASFSSKVSGLCRRWVMGARNFSPAPASCASQPREKGRWCAEPRVSSTSTSTASARPCRTPGPSGPDSGAAACSSSISGTAGATGAGAGRARARAAGPRPSVEPPAVLRPSMRAKNPIFAGACGAGVHRGRDPPERRAPGQAAQARLDDDRVDADAARPRSPRRSG